MMEDELPPMLKELAELVRTTLPTMKIIESEAINEATKNKFQALTFEPKKPSGPTGDLCTGMTIGLDVDQAIFAIHCAGKEDQVMAKPLDKVTVEELLRLLHKAFTTDN